MTHSQPFIVDNIGGAGGMIGTARAAKMPADGYSLLVSGVGSNAVMHGLNPNPCYDSLKDFVHVGQIQSGPQVLVVHPDQPFRTMQDLLAYIRKNPGKMVPLAFLNQDAVLPHVKAGKLRALAVSSARRNALFPEVPTIAEAGVTGYEAISWSGLSAIRGTPQPIIDKLEAAMKTVMASPEIRERLESQGFVVPPAGGAHYMKYVGEQIALWTRVISKSYGWAANTPPFGAAL